jgi:hypothetical protein
VRARLCCVAGAFGLTLLWFGCATDSGHSGFLGDYSALQPGAAGGPRLVYLDADVDFSGYERVIVEPVVVWKSDESRFAGVTAAQREALAREFAAELERALGEEFQVVEGAPAPGTLRVRNALTAAIAGDGSSDPRQLQYIEVELELLDAVTNQRLAAAVDSKGSSPSRSDQRPHVEAGAAFKDWAERLAVRLASLRAIDRHQRQPDAR